MSSVKFHTFYCSGSHVSHGPSSHPRSSQHAANSLMIRSRSSSTLAGDVVYSWPLMYPHKKKSNGVRSGERGGHSCSCPSNTIRFPKSSFSRAVTALVRCAGAPSCTHHPLARRPLFLSSDLPLMLTR